MRRKRARYNWFPVLGTESDVFDEGDFFAPASGRLHVTIADPAPMDIVSLTWDYPTEVEEGFDTIPSLADFQGSEYQLERTVGKFFVQVNTTNAQADPAPEQAVRCLVVAALIVLRVDEKTGAPLRSGDLSEYSPMLSENIADPWIWRRSWILAEEHTWPSQASIFYNRFQQGFPRSNALYGDIESGPHVDTRSVRRIRKEERLFLIVQAFKLDANFIPEAPQEGEPLPDIQYLFDYRILGKLVKASARGNTSR